MAPGVKSAHGIFEAELMFGDDGIGQCRAFDRRQAQMVELGLLGAQGCLDIAQTDLERREAR